MFVVRMSIFFNIDLDGLLNMHHKSIDVHAPEREQFFILLVPVQAVIIFDLRDVITSKIVVLDLLSILDTSLS